jgi:hypothetical protein
MELKPCAAPPDDAPGPGGGSAYNDGGQSFPKSTVPTGSQTPINTALGKPRLLLNTTPAMKLAGLSCCPFHGLRHSLLARFIAKSEAILGAGPDLWADHGPQSKGVGQWQ